MTVADLKEIKAAIKKAFRELSTTDRHDFPRFAASQAIEYQLVAAEEARAELDKLIRHLSMLYGRRVAETEDGTWPAKAHPHRQGASDG